MIAESEIRFVEHWVPVEFQDGLLIRSLDALQPLRYLPQGLLIGIRIEVPTVVQTGKGADYVSTVVG